MYRIKKDRVMENKNGSVVDPQSKGEELANVITHGIGAALAIAALAIIVSFAAKKGDAWKIVSLSIYGVSMIILFLMSTMSHASTRPGMKRFFEFMDYSSIYLLIAGTYTPITLVYLRGSLGWWTFGIIWGLAITGILCKVFLLGKWDFLSVIFYILMGWGLVIPFKTLLHNAPVGFMILLVAGGLFYTLGSFFYLYKKIPFHHPIWHVFVIAGSACVYFGFLFYMAI
jgi:hemolysin III